MGGVAGFAFHVERQPLGGQIGEDALMRQFQYVDRLFVEDAGDMEQRAGPVLQADAQAREAAVAGKIGRASCRERV